MKDGVPRPLGVKTGGGPLLPNGIDEEDAEEEEEDDDGCPPLLMSIPLNSVEGGPAWLPAVEASLAAVFGMKTAAPAAALDRPPPPPATAVALAVPLFSLDPL